MLQSAFARFDLDRVVEEFRRAGGDEVAAIVERVYGGDSASVTPEEWAPVLEALRPLGGGERERARTIVNVELNAPGLELMRGFDVLDQLARIECPTLVCVGELDPITPVAAAREIADALPEGIAQLAVVEDAGHLKINCIMKNGLGALALEAGGQIDAAAGEVTGLSRSGVTALVALVDFASELPQSRPSRGPASEFAWSCCSAN